MLKQVLLPAVLATLLVASHALAGENAKPGEVEAALARAKAWLELVDQGDYERSWDEAAAYFKDALEREKWRQMVGPVRKPLGKVISREVKSTTFTTTAPGAPDGRYVIIQFTTSFENKKNAIETVTPMLDKDGVWRISGYYVK
jgi:hypothetical protein